MDEVVETELLRETLLLGVEVEIEVEIDDFVLATLELTLKVELEVILLALEEVLEPDIVGGVAVVLAAMTDVGPETMLVPVDVEEGIERPIANEVL